MKKAKPRRARFNWRHFPRNAYFSDSIQKCDKGYCITDPHWFYEEGDRIYSTLYGAKMALAYINGLRY